MKWYWSFLIFVAGAVAITLVQALVEEHQGIHLETWQTWPSWGAGYAMGIWWSFWR